MLIHSSHCFRDDDDPNIELIRIFLPSRLMSILHGTLVVPFSCTVFVLLQTGGQ